MAHPFLAGIGTATAAIIAAENIFNYGLGDKVKDLGLYVYHFFASFGHTAKAVASAQVARATARLKAANAKLLRIL